MWIITEYEATSLFSLKPATATASGGKTLVTPTPFAIKMALLDVAIKSEGQPVGETAWDWLRDLRVALRPADDVVVNNTFIKVLRPRRNPADPGSADAGYFMRTITYREYAYLGGRFAIALEPSPDAELDALMRWLVGINYLGKRGSFVQVAIPPHELEELPPDFIIIDGQIDTDMPLDSLMTQLDDTSPDVSFAQVDIYSGKRLSLGKDRILHHVVLPYRTESSSRGYTYYRKASE